VILPNKHVTIKHSLLGQSMLVLQQLGRPKTVSTLWAQVQRQGGVRSYERFLLALDVLFMLGAVEFHENLLRKVKQ
jgi:hypothetical protein